MKEWKLELLGSVRQNRIVVVESGYVGTVPMMLKASTDNLVRDRALSEIRKFVV